MPKNIWLQNTFVNGAELNQRSTIPHRLLLEYCANNTRAPHGRGTKVLQWLLDFR